MQRPPTNLLLRLTCCIGGGQPKTFLGALLIGLAASLAVAAAPRSAMAQTSADQPTASDADGASATFTNFFGFGRKQVALPAGTWQLVSRHFATMDELSGTGYGAIESAVLFQTAKNAVAGFIIVR